MKALPTVFLSHGSPTTPLEDIPAKAFWAELGRRYSGVKAVLSISAHWETEQPAVNPVERPVTIHDFGGFPQALYEIEYPAPGAPQLAARAGELLAAAGVAHDLDADWGLDHGTWVPLMVMYPQADMPVAQLSIQRSLDAQEHIALGRALEPLRREGVLILGSGGAIHNLGYWLKASGPDMPTDAWAQEFDAWLTAAITGGDERGLAAYRDEAPHAVTAHPRPDHFMPLLVAYGAAGVGATGSVLHRSWYWGDLSMAAYEFTHDMTEG
jgi:4,5-DOPA dioxygenase extradiol